MGHLLLDSRLFRALQQGLFVLRVDLTDQFQNQALVKFEFDNYSMRYQFGVLSASFGLRK